MNVTPDLDARFRAAAVAEGLVDVRYDVVDVAGRRSVRRRDRPRALPHLVPRRDGMEEQLARGFGVRVLRSPLDDVRRELDEYFEGRRRDFDLPLDLRVAAVPRGRAARARARAVRAHRHLRRARRQGRAGRGPRARSAR